MDRCCLPPSRLASPAVSVASHDSDALRTALERSLLAVYEVFDAGLSKVAEGVVGQDPVEVPPGTYRISIEAAGQLLSISDVRIVSGGDTRIQIRQAGQNLGFEVIDP